MSDDKEGSQEKSFDASPTKIRKAREKGDTPQSTETNTLVLYLGVIAAIFIVGGNCTSAIFVELSSMLYHADVFGQMALSEGQSDPINKSLFTIIIAISAFLFIPFFFVLAALGIQRAIIFTPSKMFPKISRLSPVSNAKQKYGPHGMSEFFKRTVKLCLISIIAIIFFLSHFFSLPGTSLMPKYMIMKELKNETISLTLNMLMAMVLITLYDLPYTILSHLKKLRMTLQEIKEENKESEGDPHMKSERHARAMSISQSTMLRDVALANVVIVNPTHYAVALKWSREPGAVPICVAKGVDDIAFQIRKRAKQINVPIHSDPPCARSLYAMVNIGSGIKPEHFAAVAAAIHFADQLKRKAKII